MIRKVCVFVLNILKGAFQIIQFIQPNPMNLILNSESSQ